MSIRGGTEIGDSPEACFQSLAGALGLLDPLNDVTDEEGAADSNHADQDDQPGLLA
ncbi:MAG: hypothetical protein O7C74_00585 [Acidobacteria bacterium]|nr:hypothetical protein [Acidobacteriota bacterium]